MNADRMNNVESWTLMMFAICDLQSLEVVLTLTQRALADCEATLLMLKIASVSNGKAVRSERGIKTDGRDTVEAEAQAEHVNELFAGE